MEFHFRLAKIQDLAVIMKLMNETRDTIQPKEWFVEDTEDSVLHVLEGNGFVILAVSENADHIAGFFMVTFPGVSPKNLGNYMNFSDQDLLLSAHMESAAVYPAYRGHHLQAQMAAAAEDLLLKTPYRYLFATVHPDNRYSMENMLNRGFKVIKKAKIYGGLDRAILYKDSCAKSPDCISQQKLPTPEF